MAEKPKVISREPPPLQPPEELIRGSKSWCRIGHPVFMIEREKLLDLLPATFTLSTIGGDSQKPKSSVGEKAKFFPDLIMNCAPRCIARARPSTDLAEPSGESLFSPYILVSRSMFGNKPNLPRLIAAGLRTIEILRTAPLWPFGLVEFSTADLASHGR
jgi:hypothetical protein